MVTFLSSTFSIQQMTTAFGWFKNCSSHSTEIPSSSGSKCDRQSWSSKDQFFGFAISMIGYSWCHQPNGIIIPYFAARDISQETRERCWLFPISRNRGLMKLVPPEAIVSPVNPWIWTASVLEWYGMCRSSTSCSLIRKIFDPESNRTGIRECLPRIYICACPSGQLYCSGSRISGSARRSGRLGCNCSGCLPRLEMLCVV